MIILVGLPKSGTTSLHDLFLKIGIKSHHYSCNKQFLRIRKHKLLGQYIYENHTNNKPLLDFIHEEHYRKTAVTDINCIIDDNFFCFPQMDYMDKLYKENPDALFILHTRNIERMISSIHRHRNHITPFISLFDKIMVFRLQEKCLTEGIKIRFDNKSETQSTN